MIKLINLSKSFKKKEVFKNINYTFKENNVYLLVGENGSGKSTLIKLLLSFIFTTSGKIINNLNYGYCPDKINIPSYLTVKEFFDLLLKIRNYNGDYRHLIERFKLNDYLNTNVSKLSKGTFQKLLLIQAFIHNPKLMIFDEPLNGLDNKMQDEFVKLINYEKANGKIIIISTHYIEKYYQINPVIVNIKNKSLL